MYEVVFLVVEPGDYLAQITLDFTLCDGLREPPVDWFIKGLKLKKSFFTNISYKQNLRQLTPWRLSLPAGLYLLKCGLSFALASCIQTLSLILARVVLISRKNFLHALLQHKKYGIKWFPYKAIARTVIFLIPQKNRDSSRKIPARWDLGIHWRWLHTRTDWRKNGN